ncbi:MAG: hypothetical protein N4J56_000637 [Chroococcidiopsis sp. SAG 2025]|uniref:DUF3598 family protein n=1 Tax=Chroococcidiopsis sp. SAG 2025 TaxID=171389 RepID=UPI002936F0E5|nr:DUF3598 family protein [Chroococcidiopsis sp. SAG 2025]MDV2990983.1 hypothetical protein [Chroococcidiopsis sp. SAG 2025]
MRSQWECLLQNLGEWQGSFTRLSPQAEFIEDTPTVVSLAGLNDNKTIRQVVRFLPPNRPVEEKVFEYSSLGKGVLFFENGAFSQGSIQLSPVAEFGAELGLIHGDRRLRLVQLFTPNGKLDKITLIREYLTGTTTPERPPLQVDDLVGEWQGEAVTIYPDWRSPDTYPTQLQIERLGSDRLTQQLTIYSTLENPYQISSTSKITGSLLYFEGSQPDRQMTQVMLLPDGASATCPQQVQLRQAFFLEVGWLVQPNLRQRLIRRYNDKGEWTSLTLVTERK